MPEPAAAAPRSASGCSAGSRPSRAGRPTDPRAPPPPSRARRRRSAGSPPASVSAARRGRCGRRRGAARSVLDERAQAVEVVGERARLELRALLDLALGRASRAAASTSSTRSRSTTTAPSASSTTTSPWRIVAPPTSTGSPIVPGTFLSAPRTRTQRAQTGSPSSRSSSTSRTAASTSSAATPRPLRLGREQVADERDRPRLGHRQHEHLAGLGLGDRRRAPSGCRPGRSARCGPDRPRASPGRPGPASTSTTGDRAAASCTVAEPSSASSAYDAHSAPTTCGVTRWNASANSIAVVPRRAARVVAAPRGAARS